MAYASNDLGSATWLAGNIIYQATQQLLNADGVVTAKDVEVLDKAVLLMDAVTSFFTEDDTKFRKEWEGIVTARKAARITDETGKSYPYEPGFDEGMDADFRFKEIKAMFRSMCRAGKFTRLDPPSAEWKAAP